MKPTDIRNIAIIAHVDHGKTTLVDAMLKQSRIFRDNQHVDDRVMDSNDLERERGITILSKNTAITYQDIKINIIDTPGHADFGGEVERVMNMVDGVLLLVDSVEGPMPQTKFVLRQALSRGHKVIVVVNKIDRANARPDYVINTTFDLFVDLGATEEQAEFPVIYTSALAGIAGKEPEELTENLEPLFEEIVEYLPHPNVSLDEPTQMQATLMGFDDYKGKIVIGRLNSGRIQKNQPLIHITEDGSHLPVKAAQVFTHQGLNRVEVEEATCGDIIALTGLGDVGIGDTIADADNPRALPRIKVEEPTLRVTFGINTSPFAGREGKFVTSRKLRERLYLESERDVALKVAETDSAETFYVSGRGELHLGILIENMRREGFEFEVSKPEVILKKIEDKWHEPFESVEVEVSEAYQGAVVELLGQRKGQMQDMQLRDNGLIHYTFLVPTRGLIGFRQQFLTATRGEGLINTLFAGYQPFTGDIQTRSHGSLVAWEPGETNNYGLHAAQERGQLFIPSGTPVYEGMVVGQHIREGDLEVNVCKKKQLTNFRASGSDDSLRLEPPKDLSLDDALEYLAEDELLEVTPESFRIRKRVLAKNERRRLAKQGGRRE
ncbi:translational GTPase TypA [Mechercharimyces sp. CAU 1602]|uniref:translational GTPase TypA n=1 Tax=Mechercharimyces sp. CAU 1602 TaxID=2973933 RepID=UPI0021619239|nr:translational GTPase TypA [Mechercharimyces sp. CAU 1602]MCS1351735.1 translational GTPase TypA [Mechercharimyces sp. CAU 1602]